MADIWINILGNATKLKSALGGAGKDMTAFGEKIGKVGRTMTIVGGAVTAAFGAIILKTTQLGDTYDKMSKRTNISVETLSALGYAAKISGADLDTVEKSLRYLARGMDDMSMGVGEAKDAFEYLDIAVTDTEGKLRPTIDVLKEAATKLAAMTDETKQIALATDIFGARYGTQLLPLLKEGGAGIEDLMNKAKDLGIVMSTEAAEKAAEFNDRLTDLKDSIGAAGRGIGELLIPPLTNLAEKAIEMIKKIKTWADAHKPLVEVIIKVGATLGVLAAVGGPILMAVSAFIKMKAAMALIGTIASGPIGIIIAAIIGLALAWKTNFGGIRDFTDRVIEKLKVPLDWLSDKIDKIKKGLAIFGKQIGIIKEDFATGEEAIKAFTEATENFGDKVGSVAEQIEEKLGGTIEELKKMADLEVILKPAEEAIKKIIDSMTPYEKKLEAINLKYDEAIERVKTIIKDEKELKTTTDKLNEGRKAEITLLDRQKTALEKVAEAKKKLADLTKSLTDKIYEFTHTKYEVSLRDINREYDLLVENAKEVFASEKELAEAIKIINEKRQEEIDILEESNKLKEEATEDNVDLKESYEDLKKPIEEVAETTKEAGEVAKDAGILGGQGWEDFSIKIKKATTTLSNFSKEGVASAIASIKMHFKPLLDSLVDDINRLTGVWKVMAEANLASLKESMNEQISVIKYGYEEYLKILESMGGGTGGGMMFPSYQTGIRYVPQTGLAVVHRGEEINPPGQRSYDQRKFYTSSSSINIMPGAINIITPKFSEADGQEMFGIIERQAKMRGLKLVRE